MNDSGPGRVGFFEMRQVPWISSLGSVKGQCRDFRRADADAALIESEPI